MPFGAVGSVVAWDRVGELLEHLMRKLLHVAILRWVDDFYSPEDDEEVLASFQIRKGLDFALASHQLLSTSSQVAIVFSSADLRTRTKIMVPIQVTIFIFVY